MFYRVCFSVYSIELFYKAFATEITEITEITDKALKYKSQQTYRTFSVNSVAKNLILDQRTTPSKATTKRFH